MATPFRVIVLPEAFDDLDHILDHIAKDSPQRARETLDLVWSATESLHVFPYRFKIHRSNRNPRRVIRSMPVEVEP